MKMHWLTVHRLALSSGLSTQAANSFIKSIDGVYVDVDDSVVESSFLQAQSGNAITASTGEGPGKELSLLLHQLGITERDCACRSRAAQMNIWGVSGCEANLEEIVGWLRESASDRGLPFLDVAGRVLVRRAIANARRKEQARAKEAQAEGPAAAG